MSFLLPSFINRFVCLIALGLLSASSGPSFGKDAPKPFDRMSTFKSCAEFEAALLSLQPRKVANIYSRAFSIEDIEETQKDALIVPERIEKVTELWRSDDEALIFATAEPPTQATPTEVGLLIVFWKVNDSWQLKAVKRYETLGKYGSITCELTSRGIFDYVPGKGNTPPVVTLTRCAGGRGGTTTTSWTLELIEGRLFEVKGGE